MAGNCKTLSCLAFRIISTILHIPLHRRRKCCFLSIHLGTINFQPIWQMQSISCFFCAIGNSGHRLNSICQSLISPVSYNKRIIQILRCQVFSCHCFRSHSHLKTIFSHRKPQFWQESQFCALPRCQISISRQ